MLLETCFLTFLYLASSFDLISSPQVILRRIYKFYMDRLALIDLRDDAAFFNWTSDTGIMSF